MFCLTCDVRNLTNEKKSAKGLKPFAFLSFKQKSISGQWKPFDLREVCSNVSILHFFD